MDSLFMIHVISIFISLACALPVIVMFVLFMRAKEPIGDE